MVDLNPPCPFLRTDAGALRNRSAGNSRHFALGGSLAMKIPLLMSPGQVSSAASVRPVRSAIEAEPILI